VEQAQDIEGGGDVVALIGAGRHGEPAARSVAPDSGSRANLSLLYPLQRPNRSPRRTAPPVSRVILKADL
jgi:hypothetical protein